MTVQTIMGQKQLKAQVQDNGLCTGCGACVNLCPYHVFYRDKTIVLNPCDITSGRCWAFCPRTPFDTGKLRELFSDDADMTSEIGPVKGFFVVRAADAGIRSTAQHGGTVSALMSLALQEGLIDAAVVAEGNEQLQQKVSSVQDAKEIPKRAKSKFIVSPTIAEFNRTARTDVQRIGVVATPCQTFALAKMRLKPDINSGDNPIDKLKLVIGLFCGFTLSWAKLLNLLEKTSGVAAITGMEVPPGEGVIEVYTIDATIKIPMQDVAPLIREACRYCIDTTAEYADISVGSARFLRDWQQERIWNQIIVRTEAGKQLLNLAKEKGVLEFHDVSSLSLETLKQAAWEKKKTALANIVKKSGSIDDLLYLDTDDQRLSGLRYGG